MSDLEDALTEARDYCNFVSTFGCNYCELSSLCDLVSLYKGKIDYRGESPITFTGNILQLKLLEHKIKENLSEVNEDDYLNSVLRMYRLGDINPELYSHLLNNFNYKRTFYVIGNRY